MIREKRATLNGVARRFIMIYKFIIAGLVIIPFYEVLADMLPFVNIDAPDTRAGKLAVATIFALVIFAVSAYKGCLKEFKNKWVLVMLVYLVAVEAFMPNLKMVIMEVEHAHFWIWEPLFRVICFTLLLWAISTCEFTGERITRILKVICWCGTVMAGYVVLQSIGADEFFKVKPSVNAITQPNLGGTMGQATLVSPFIAMVVPLALFLKKRWQSVVMIGAVILTLSQVAIGAMCVGLVGYFAHKNKAALISGTAVLLIGAVVLGVGYFKSPVINGFIKDSARFEAWGETLEDIKDFPLKNKKSIAITGAGISGFTHFNRQFHDNGFREAHNEYLEILYDTGAIGLILFLLAIFTMVKERWTPKKAWNNDITPYRVALLTSFLTISLCALGTFPWHLGATIFYTIVICGLLTNPVNDYTGYPKQGGTS